MKSAACRSTCCTEPRSRAHPDRWNDAGTVPLALIEQRETQQIANTVQDKAVEKEAANLSVDSQGG